MMNSEPKFSNYLLLTAKDRETITLLFVLFSLSRLVAPILGSNLSYKGFERTYRYQVDLNAAPEIELQTLSGIGETLSGAIVRYREENGAFSSVEEIEKIRGIGPKKLEAIRPFLMEVGEKGGPSSGRLKPVR